MRSVELSKTFENQLIELLDFGEQRFGQTTAAASRRRVEITIRDLLADHPAIKTPDKRLGLVRYHVTRTPFVLVYDFDDLALRVHFILHIHADLNDLDPHSAQW